MTAAARTWIDEPSSSLKILDLGRVTVQPNCNLRLGQSYERASTDGSQSARVDPRSRLQIFAPPRGPVMREAEPLLLLMAVPEEPSLGLARTDVAYQFEVFDEFCGQLTLEFINFAYNN